MQSQPIIFKRGGTFSYVFSFKLPEGFDPLFFREWRVDAFLQGERSANCDRPIALSFYWANKECTAVLVYHNMTDGWELGKYSMNLIFTNVGGQKVQSYTVPFIVKSEVHYD